MDLNELQQGSPRFTPSCQAAKLQFVTIIARPRSFCQIWVTAPPRPLIFTDFEISHPPKDVGFYQSFNDGFLLHLGRFSEQALMQNNDWVLHQSSADD
jgi:hypothetical protein